jgi:hypothetical protein
MLVISLERDFVRKREEKFVDFMERFSEEEAENGDRKEKKA